METAGNEQERRDALPRGAALRDYTIEDVLGHGGFGIVYRARHNELGNVVAVKEYLPIELALREGASVHPRSAACRAGYEDGLRRFRDEARALIEFQSHPSIVSCREFFRANGTAYLVMEYEDGMPLSELLHRREASGRPFDEADLLAVMVPLLEGLQRVHEVGMLHRDIKPSNILVRRSDERPVLIDFGAAKQMAAEHSKSLAPFTEGYAALEQVGEGNLGPWTDLYAVGAVMWRIVAGGNLPWEPPNPVKVEKRANAVVRATADPMPSARKLGAGRFSAGVLDAIDRCLKLHEKERISGCGELLALLRGTGAAEKAPAVAVSTAAPQARSRKRLWGMLTATGLVLTAAAAWFALGPRDERSRASLEVAALSRAEAQWEAVRDSRDAAAARAYIEEYGGVEGAGVWVRLAESLLMELEGQTKEREAAAAARRRKAEDARTAWEKVKGTQSESVLAAYIARWEREAEAAEFMDEARARLDDLARIREAREKTAQAEAQWAAVRDRRDAAAARAYIEEYGGIEEAGVWVRLAESLLGELDREERAETEERERLTREEAERKRPGRRFRDCDACPEMVVVPAGSFLMGSRWSEEGRDRSEGPQHRVTIREPFAVGVYEVTREEYGTFVAEMGHAGGSRCFVWTGSVMESREGADWRSPGYAQTGRDPVVCVNWEDAQAYVRWLSGKTGEKYRLLSEAEWEYAARAGSRTRYSFGDEITESDANYDMNIYDVNIGKTRPVGSYRANGYGLYDLHGNVREWVQDCWNDNYGGAPSNGEAWERGACSRRVLRGGSWNSNSRLLRSASRDWYATGHCFDYLGFRVARTLAP